MVVNDIACFLDEPVVPAFFASRLAPTESGPQIPKQKKPPEQGG